MNRNLLLPIVIAAALFATACEYVSLSPETDINPVGTTHTVTATLALDFPDNICEIAPFPLPGCDGFPPIGGAAVGDTVTFEVVDGPNAGAQSDGDCGPNSDQLCAVSIPGDSTSWTYLGDGGPGIDYIEVCFSGPIVEGFMAAAAQETGMTEEQLIEMFSPDAGSQQESGENPEINEPESGIGCDIVSKVWLAPIPEPTPDPTLESRERVERSVPNIGAGLSGLFNGQPTALPGAAAVSPAATSPVIRPPSTGDAGLR